MHMKSITDEIKSVISQGLKFKILFYGDSTTSTEWVHPNWRGTVEYVLKEELENFEPASQGIGSWNYSWWNINFINAGLNGATTNDFIARLERDVLSYNPDMIISITGDNDVDKITEKEHAQNHQKIVEMLVKKVRFVYYATSIYTANEYHNRRYSSYVNELKKMFPLEGVSLIDLFDLYSKCPVDRFFTYKVDKEAEKFLTDGSGGDTDTFHPNALGNAYIAKILLKEIFGVEFDPEMYLADINRGIKYPRYR